MTSERSTARLRATASAASERIGADHFTGFADESCDEKRNIADTAPDLEHAHTRSDARLDHEPARNGLDEPGLNGQAIELAIQVGRARTEAPPRASAECGTAFGFRDG